MCGCAAASMPLVRPGAVARLRGIFGVGSAMNLSFRLQPLAGAVVLIGAASISAQADGTFDMPAGAHFNAERLERITEFFRKEVDDGKIPGAIVLVSQHGKPVYYEKFGQRDVTAK